MIKDSIYEVKKVEEPHPIETSVPGSKSITNRALLLAALAEGTSVLRGVLFSDDSRHFMQALDDLGFPIHIGLFLDKRYRNLMQRIHARLMSVHYLHHSRSGRCCHTL